MKKKIFNIIKVTKINNKKGRLLKMLKKEIGIDIMINLKKIMLSKKLK